MVRKKFRKKQIMVVVAFTVIVVFVLSFYIWHQMESVRIGYTINELKKKIKELSEEVEKLEAKRSELLSLERVEKVAKEELNLAEPREDQIIRDDSNF
jgi:cell division protein FtsL